MNATEKEQSHRVRFFYIFQTDRAQRPRRSQKRGNGGRQRNGAGMEKHSQESNQQSKLESVTGPFSNINIYLMFPLIQKINVINLLCKLIIIYQCL